MRHLHVGLGVVAAVQHGDNVIERKRLARHELPADMAAPAIPGEHALTVNGFHIRRSTYTRETPRVPRGHLVRITRTPLALTHALLLLGALPVSLSDLGVLLPVTPLV